MARQVLYVDGELPIELLQERIRIIMRSCNLDTQGHLKLITPDLQEFGTPNIATVEGQAMIEEHLGGVDLLVLDNLSCLCRGGVENEAESWEPVQEWLLRLRSRGITVLFDHHAGRSGNPRGTSKREDVIDLIVGLKAPDNYTPEEGARFEIHFEKARGLHGKAIEAIEASLQADANGNPVWTTRTIEDAVLRRVIDLAADGLSQADIATEIGRHKSTVSRALKNVREKLDDEAAKVRVKVRNLLNGAGKEGLAPEQIAAQLRIEEQEVRFHLVGCAKRRSDGRWIAS
jgi:putative DNA primase/helicase